MAFFTEGQPAPQAGELLGRALSALRWQDKQSFTPQDVLTLETRMLDAVREELSGNDDAFAQKMEVVMGAARKLLEDPHLLDDDEDEDED